MHLASIGRSYHPGLMALIIRALVSQLADVWQLTWLRMPPTMTPIIEGTRRCFQQARTLKPRCWWWNPCRYRPKHRRRIALKPSQESSDACGRSL